MPDRNELIASFEGRVWGGEMHKGGYIHVPQEEAEAILELLKGQEPRVLTLEEAIGGDECWFEHINGACGYADLYVHENGMVGVSRINKIISFIPAESYGKQWRCWSYRPTDEQRKAVKWG